MLCAKFSKELEIVETLEVGLSMAHGTTSLCGRLRSGKWAESKTTCDAMRA